jgi:hypothetical protein
MKRKSFHLGKVVQVGWRRFSEYGGEKMMTIKTRLANLGCGRPLQGCEIRDVFTSTAYVFHIPPPSFRYRGLRGYEVDLWVLVGEV